jgi:hypothetical protein
MNPVGRNLVFSGIPGFLVFQPEDNQAFADSSGGVVPAM